MAGGDAEFCAETNEGQEIRAANKVKCGAKKAIRGTKFLNEQCNWRQCKWRGSTLGQKSSAGFDATKEGRTEGDGKAEENGNAKRDGKLIPVKPVAWARHLNLH